MVTRLDAVLAERLARLALMAIARPYPYHLSHVVKDERDVAPPAALWPAFHGAFDWHSAVHGHWTLARLARLFPDAPFAPEARAALECSLTAEHLAAEHAYLAAHPGFERPYGLAWTLALGGELGALGPLVALAARRLAAHFSSLPFPVRSGEHGQTAFAMALALDWARSAGHELAQTVEDRARAFYLADVAAPVAYEPSGHDFLSPSLAEAALLGRVLEPEPFARWLSAFLPRVDAFTPVFCPDPADGKLSHLDGLNLSRAWMLRGIARALPHGDARRAPLDAAATVHLDAGLASLSGEHWEGAHWLASFVCLALT